MKKEDVLAKSKQENANGDEREKDIYLKRDVFSLWGLSILSIVFIIIGIMRNDPALDVITIVFCTTGLRFVYDGFALKKRSHIIWGIFFLAAALFVFVFYCMRLFA